MSTLTPNLSLVKPAPTDFVDIVVLDANYDLIDTAVQAAQVAANGNGSAIPVVQKGVALGVATLDAGGLVPAAQLGGVAWTAPMLGNSWANYGSGQQVAGYRKTSSDDIELRGNIAGGTTGTAIFTLPAGYRPSAIEIFFGTAGNGVAVLAVLTTGAVQVLSYVATGSNSAVVIVFRFSTL